MTIELDRTMLPSGKHTKNYGKSPFSMGKSTINGHCPGIVWLYKAPLGLARPRPRLGARAADLPGSAATAGDERL